MPSTTLPDALADALGRVVADVQRQARKDIDLITAECRGIVANLKLEISVLTAELLKIRSEDRKRIDDALANVKHGERGLPGEKGEPGVAGERGEKGDPGERGDVGLAGERGLPGEKGEPGVAGERGEKGDPGERGDSGLQGKEGPEGKPGRDGRDGLPGLNGKAGDAGLAGKDGVDGKDGRDGFSLEDFDASSADGGRTIALSFSRGETVVKREIRTGLVLDQGVWKDGSYLKGDGVTFGGHYWIAQCDTKEKPEISRDWRMALRKARDGKSGEKGDKGERGPKGDPGIDRR
jgi:hypothetical protein